MRDCYGKYPEGEFPCMFCEDRRECKEVVDSKKNAAKNKNKLEKGMQ